MKACKGRWWDLPAHACKIRDGRTRARPLYAHTKGRTFVRGHTRNRLFKPKADKFLGATQTPSSEGSVSLGLPILDAFLGLPVASQPVM